MKNTKKNLKSKIKKRSVSKKTNKKEKIKNKLMEKKKQNKIKNNILLEKKRILNKLGNIKNLKQKIENFKKEDDKFIENFENKNSNNKEIKIISNVLENQNFEITDLLQKVKKVNCETKLTNLMSNINLNIQEVKKSNQNHLNDKNKKLFEIKNELQMIEDKNNYYTKKILELQSGHFSDILIVNKERENNLKKFEKDLDFFFVKNNDNKLENPKLKDSNKRLINFLKKYYSNLVKNN